MQARTPLSLLIVDDEIEIRKGLQSALDWQALQVEIIGLAEDGRQALERIRILSPDVVITDIRMPQMDGLAMIQQAQAEGYGGHFIILSGYDDFDYARSALRHGVQEYLLKPITLDELRAAIETIRDKVRRQQKKHAVEQSQREELRLAADALRAQQLIPDLLHRAMEAKELEESLHLYHIPLQNAPCQVVLLQMLEPPLPLDPSSVEGTLPGPAEVVAFLLKQLKGSPALITEYGEQKILMVFNTPFAASGYSDLPSFLLSTLEEMNKQLGVRCIAAIGEEAPDLLRLSFSYQNALQVLPWHIYTSLRPVLTPAVLSTEWCKQPPPAPENTPLLEAILQGDARLIMTELTVFFGHLFYVPTPPPHYLYAMCNYLVIDLQKQLIPYADTPLESFTTDAYMTLQRLESLQEIKDWVASTLISIARELSNHRQKKEDPVLEKALAYINAHILDQLRIEDVCAHVGLSKSYFTAYFKSKTQQNFRDYVLNRKILYAQNQMKIGKISLAALSDLLGYEDYRSFNRAFRARTGFSPSQYQQKYSGPLQMS